MKNKNLERLMLLVSVFIVTLIVIAVFMLIVEKVSGIDVSQVKEARNFFG